ncbi:MAG: Transketolase 1 [Chloroflexi bacterium ADurb.Bin325]|nr:MAG: Transketolase 1 [Chloroflexi bacterium ADurb.Bin325]
MSHSADATSAQAVPGFDALDDLCANVIRGLAMDGVQKADSGHPGMPMGMANVAHVIWSRFLRLNPRDANWFNRDRFVLSAGHGSMLLYSLLHLTGYALPMDELKAFRQLGSKTPGHPEHGHTEGVETTTGPLGQGFATGVGMALAEAFLAANYNRPGFDLVDHYVYAIVSDGDLEEGISHEAASLAGHLKLGKLIYYYDDNNISIDGPTSLSYSDNVPLRFEAYGWHVQTVSAYDMPAIAAATVAAQQVTDRPSLIVCKSHIAYGSPNKQDTSASHGAPLGAEEVRLTKQALGLPPDEYFWVPDEVYARYRQIGERGAQLEAAWNEQLAAYKAADAELGAAFQAQVLDHKLPEGWEEALPVWQPGDKIATRAASGKVLDAIGPRIPTLIGGSADLTPSNNTRFKGVADVKPGDFAGRYIRFGIREHAMGAMLNGMALHGGVHPYGGTFLVFSDYMRGAVRLTAIMRAPVIFVWTHDSVGVGEDGPTHQPVEHMLALRAIPGLVVLRPADANETAAAWRYALTHRDRPVALLLTRQGLTVMAGTEDHSRTARGGYVLADAADGRPDVILIAAGSEVNVAMAARDQLAAQNIAARVVSMPSWELFDAQDAAYRETVLPAAIKARVTVEAGVTLGWERYAGDAGAMVGIDRFGESGKGPAVMAYLGITPENVTQHALKVLGR